MEFENSSERDDSLSLGGNRREISESESSSNSNSNFPSQKKKKRLS